MSSLNVEAFEKFLKKGGRSPNVVKKVIAQVDAFRRYLLEERGCKNIEEAGAEDLEAFVSFVEEKKKGSAKKYLHSIHYYYDYTSNEEMRDLAGKLRRQRIMEAPFPLEDFRGINQAHVEKLAGIGVRNVKDMLVAGRTRKARLELAAKTGVPEEAILELVKLSDLARLSGVKSIRARLYYDAGVDTAEKMAKWEPEKLRAMLIDFVEKTRFQGIPPLPKEAESTVAAAKKLPKIVEY
jgi:site-specific recombinase XerD